VFQCFAQPVYKQGTHQEMR